MHKWNLRGGMRQTRGVPPHATKLLSFPCVRGTFSFIHMVAYRERGREGTTREVIVCMQKVGHWFRKLISLLGSRLVLTAPIIGVGKMKGVIWS